MSKDTKEKKKLQMLAELEASGRKDYLGPDLDKNSSYEDIQTAYVIMQEEDNWDYYNR